MSAIFATPGRCQCAREGRFSRTALPTAAAARCGGQLVAAVAVTAAPWVFGGVELRAQVWLLGASLVAAICLLIAILADGKSTVLLPLAALPLLAALVLGFGQLLPLNPKMAGWLSPRGAELRQDLMSETNASDVALAAGLDLPPLPDRQPLSLYPASTRLDLAWLALAAALFVFGAVLFASPQAQVRLWAAVAVNGAAIAFFGLVQKLSFNGMLYWRVPLTQGGEPFASFVNRNNAAGFLNLCLAAALGLTIWAFQGSGFLAVRPAGRFSPDEPHVARRPPWHALRDFVAHLEVRTLAAVTLAGVISAGIICSLSRGGMLSMAVAAAVVAATALASRRFSGRLVWAGAAVLAGLILVSWVGMGGAAKARLATVLERPVLEEGRLRHWRDAVQAVPDFWRCGSGLGTYRYIYGLYLRQPASSWYCHAENEYLEILVEGGVIGLGLLLALLALIGTASWRLLRSGPDHLAPVAGLVGMFALASQAVHALCDFGLHMPSNAMLFAILCGAAAGRAAQLKSVRPVRGTLAGRLVPVAIGSGLAIVAAWGACQAAGGAKVQTAMKHIPPVRSPSEDAPSLLSQSIARMSESLAAWPEDAVGQSLSAKLWIGLYRNRAFQDLCRQWPSQAHRGALWETTSPRALHERACRLARVNMTDSLGQLRQDRLVEENLAVALKHLVLARRACPLLPDVHLLIAELSVLVAEPGTDRVHLDRAKRVASWQPELLQQCSVVAYQSRRPDVGLESRRKRLALGKGG